MSALQTNVRFPRVFNTYLESVQICISHFLSNYTYWKSIMSKIQSPLVKFVMHLGKQIGKS